MSAIYKALKEMHGVFIGGIKECLALGGIVTPKVGFMLHDDNGKVLGISWMPDHAMEHIVLRMGITECARRLFENDSESAKVATKVFKGRTPQVLMFVSEGHAASVGGEGTEQAAFNKAKADLADPNNENLMAVITINFFTAAGALPLVHFIIGGRGEARSLVDSEFPEESETMFINLVEVPLGQPPLH